MAGIPAAATTPADVALVAATAKTILQIVAPTNQRLELLRWGVFFDGVTPTNTPVLVELLRQTTAGTSTATTPVAHGAGTETLQSTAGYNFSAEPTAGAILDIAKVHPQSGYEVLLPLNQQIEVLGGGRLGIRVTAAQVVNCRAKLIYIE
jgi:hypothetical protein